MYSAVMKGKEEEEEEREREGEGGRRDREVDVSQVDNVREDRFRRYRVSPKEPGDREKG